MTLSFSHSLPSARAIPGPGTILHIEDDMLDAVLLQSIMEEADWPDPAFRPHRLLQAESLAKAYGILAAEPVDAIILDLCLRDSRGLETCARLLEDFPHVPVVVLTGDADPRQGVEAVRLGAQDFLNKNEVSAVSLWKALTFGMERQLIRDALARALTEKEAAQRAAEREKITAQKASRVKTDFLAMIGHEFHTPLNGIVGLATALETVPESPDAQTHAGAIRESGERIGPMLDELVDLLAVESGSLALEHEPFHPQDILATVVDGWRAPAAEKGLVLKTDQDWGGLPSLVGDGRRIAQVFGHILGNAVKFTESGSVEVRAELLHTDGPMPSLRVDVIDTGTGQPDHVWRHLAERFERADPSMARRHGGLGLGLTLAKETVSLMGGCLHLGNAVAGGAHVWFSVPVHPAPGTRPSASQTIGGHSLGSLTESCGTLTLSAAQHILVVEDMPINRQVFDAILKHTGLSYEFAEDGWSALDMTGQRRYDLILMDIQLPGLDGIEVTRRIRAQSPLNMRTPIVAVTAHGVASERARFLSAGMDDYVAKPVTPKSLLSAIERNVSRGMVKPGVEGVA